MRADQEEAQTASHEQARAGEEDPERGASPPLCIISPMILLFGMITTTLPMHLPSERSAMWQRASLEGLLMDSGLDEISGLAKSTRGPYLWAHNDSGDGAYLWLLDLHGALLKKIRLNMNDPYDNEDITLGPCAPDALSTRCLYLGDIGDNRRARKVVHVHQFEEPDLPENILDTNTYPESLTPSRTITLAYPGGEAHDAEALMSDPRTGSLYLMTKPRTAPATLYKVPDAALLKGSASQTPHLLEPISSAWMKHESHSGRLVTAGEFSADGRCLILRTYLEVLTYCKRHASDPWHGILEDTSPDRFTPPAMLQAESIAIDHATHTIWLTSERRFSPVLKMQPQPEFAPRAQGKSP